MSWARMRDNIAKYHNGFGLFVRLDKPFSIKYYDINESEIYEILYL